MAIATAPVEKVFGNITIMGYATPNMAILSAGRPYFEAAEVFYSGYKNL
jgi:hypothetical protein